MTNIGLLKEKIDNSGLKVNKITEKLGISKTAYHNKMNGKVEFKSGEIKTLKFMLQLTNEEVVNIFLS